MNVCPVCDKPLPQTARECACGWTLPERVERDYVAEHTERAKQSLAEQGLDRKPDETADEWRKRTLRFVRERMTGINKAEAA